MRLRVVDDHNRLKGILRAGLGRYWPMILALVLLAWESRSWPGGPGAQKKMFPNLNKNKIGVRGGITVRLEVMVLSVLLRITAQTRERRLKMPCFMACLFVPF